MISSGRGEHGSYSALLTPRRWRLSPLRRFLAFRRRCREAAVGLVPRRWWGVGKAFAIHPINRSTASCRFRSCVRKRRASITKTPSPVSRLATKRSSLSLTSRGSEAERRTSKRRRTAVSEVSTEAPAPSNLLSTAPRCEGGERHSSAGSLTGTTGTVDRPPAADAGGAVQQLAGFLLGERDQLGVLPDRRQSQIQQRGWGYPPFFHAHDFSDCRSALKTIGE